MSMIAKLLSFKLYGVRKKKWGCIHFKYISRPLVLGYMWVFVFCLFQSIWWFWDISIVKVCCVMVMWVFISLGYRHKHCGCSNKRCTPWVFPTVRLFIQHHHQIPHQFYEVYFLHRDLLPPFFNIFFHLNLLNRVPLCRRKQFIEVLFITYSFTLWSLILISDRLTIKNFWGGKKWN